MDLSSEDLLGHASPELSALLSPLIDPLFWRPTRLRVDSAWYGHLPFAHWIVQATRPRTLVELGTHAGLSYSAFCEAVARLQLDTRCFAIDTWAGDEHAGFYGEEIFADWQRFHDSRYAAFSQLLRCTFDEALPYIADASVDLLHVDGRHSYADVAHDFAAWQPKLSPSAVVLFHDTNVRERDFGVWRLWTELRESYPGFEFLHEHGLGVLAYGVTAPEPVAELCRLAASPGGVGARLRERFTLLGERWMADVERMRMERAVEVSARHARDMERDFHIIEEYSRALGGGGHPPSSDTMSALRAATRAANARAVASDLQARHEAARAATAAAEAAQLRQQIEHLAAQAAHAEATARQAAEARHAAAEAGAEAAALRHQRDALIGSASWRVTAPLRYSLNRLRPVARSAGSAMLVAHETAPVATEPAAPKPQSLPASSATAAPRRPRALFVGGEPHTPGMQYRSVRYAAAARTVGWDAEAKPVEQVTFEDLRDADLVLLWRTDLTGHVENIINITREYGGRLGLDLDDLMHRPELARIGIIDGIRTIQTSEEATAAMFQRIGQVLARCDFATATTPELAASMSSWLRATYVLPNGFDADTMRVARLAARRREQTPDDGLVRLGYAAGSRTHQNDFAVLADAVAAVLRARPQARLVLFRSHGKGLVMTEEFPALDGLAEQIEWRELVPLDELPNEIARFDVNLVPLEVGNPFVEAKSELKYPEAALAGVCTVASPTGPYRRAIDDGVTGFLPDSPAAWETILLRLVDDATLRARVARAARLDARWRFGPERRGDLMREFLSQQAPNPSPGDAAMAARAFAAALGRGDARRPTPAIRDAETIFHHDSLGEAAVTVAVSLYNYADFVLEALESARLQTLPALDLVVVDDASTDPSGLEMVLEWVRTHAGRFNRVVVLRHRENAGLGAARNAAFAAAETPWVLPLDADNRLLPTCAERLLAHATEGAAFVYPKLKQFGEGDAVFSGQRWEPQRLVGSNYVDALALVAVWAWAAAGGYYVRRDAMGWEDYDLWCGLAELGQFGVAVPEVLAEYRVHATSMVDTVMETAGTKEAMVDLVERRHPWVRVLARKPTMRGR